MWAKKKSTNAHARTQTHAYNIHTYIHTYIHIVSNHDTEQLFIATCGET